MRYFAEKLEHCLIIGLAAVSALFLQATPLFAASQSFLGEVVASADPDSYERVEVLITGEAANAIFNATAAIVRVENISENSRIVRGRNLYCYEFINDDQPLVVVEYSCKVIIGYGGTVINPSY